MKKSLLLSIVLCILATNKSWGWWDKSTHRILAQKVVELSFDQEYRNKPLKLLGKEQKTEDWLQDGAQDEDKGKPTYITPFEIPDRSLNHFHNPTKPLADAGLNDFWSGTSAVAWAQDRAAQSVSGMTGGDWTWQYVRESQYNSLTYQETGNRDAFEATMLKGLGYQMHLVQDMSQPNHVRNDAHVFDGAGIKIFGYNNFETWAKNNPNKVVNAISNTTPTVTVNLTEPFPGSTVPAPVARLYDNRASDAARTITPSTSLSQGLSEYTNANFFSEDTIFSAERYASDDKHYFAHPAKSETNLQEFIDGTLLTTPYILSEGTDIGPPVTGFTISKQNTTDGQKLDCIAKPGPYAKQYYNERGEDSAFYGSFVQDDHCFEDQAKYLFPRTVAYSKAMLDYFFRGTIKLTTTPGDVSFRSVKVTAENITTGEAMGPGEVKLVIRYKALPESPLGGDKYLLGAPSAEYTYKVSAPQNIDLTNPQPLTFDFSSDPLPYYFNDMSMQLVFKGKLGNEEGAVAVSPLKPIDGIYSDFAITRPTSGIYAKTTGTTSSATFNELRLTAQTDIPGGLTGGVFKLFLKYRLAGSNPFLSQPVDTEPANDTGYVVRRDVTNAVTSLQPGVPAELVFDLSTAPLPVWATDVSLLVIYADAGTLRPIAVGFHDIAEPTPVDFINNMDHVCVKTDPNPAVTTGSYLMAGSQEAIAAVGTNAAGRPNSDIYPHRLKDVYVAFTSTPASPTNYSAKFPLIQPGEYGRLVVLADYDFNVSSSVTVENIYGPLEDVWGMAFGNSVSGIRGVMNQLVYEGGEYVSYYPPMDSERGTLSWWFTHFEDAAWPIGTTCDRSGAQPNLSGPVPVELP